MSVRPQESPPARTARILLRAAGAAFSLPERLPRVSKGRTGSGAGMDLVWRGRPAGGGGGGGAGGGGGGDPMGGGAGPLAAPNARMREIFAISRYDKLFAIVDDVDSDA